MAKSLKIVKISLSGSAHQLAFRIGQSLEQVLITRAVKIAGEDANTSSEVLVTVDHIRRALDLSLLEETCSSLGVFIHGEMQRPSKTRTA